MKLLSHMIGSVLGMALLVALAMAQAPGGGPQVGRTAGAPRTHVPGEDALAAGKHLGEPHQKVALIRLDRPVDAMMQRSINRRLDLARKAGCTLIVFEMDTYGGSVQSALEISKLIKKLPAEKIDTAAWVHDKAYSGGAMITAACQYVVMSSQGTYGLCAPIRVATTWTGEQRLDPLPPDERAKITNPITAEFDDSADANGWDRTLLHAMVLAEIEIHQMRSVTGEVKFVDTPGRVRLSAEMVEKAGGLREPTWSYVRTVDNAEQLLTANHTDALAMGLSDATVDTHPQLKALFRIQDEPILMPYSWAENTTVFLTGLGVRILLFVGFLVLLWAELSHPGFSFFGIGAILCLVLLLGAPFLTGLAQVWEIVIILLGLGVIILDVLVFGGVGMLAIPGFILMAIGLVASFIPADPGGGFAGSQSVLAAVQRGLAVVVGGSFLAAAVFWFLAKYLYMVPGINRLQLAAVPVSPGDEGPAVVRDVADRPVGDAVFVGALGMATTDLRPAGKARFGEHLVGVVSQGSYIANGTEIVVIEVTGLRVVVKPHVVATPGVADSGGPASAPGAQGGTL